MRFVEQRGKIPTVVDENALRACLKEYNDDTGIAALRLGNALERAERDRGSDEAVREELADIRATIGARLRQTDVEEAVERSRRHTSDRFHGRTSDSSASYREETTDGDDDDDGSDDARR